MGDNSGLYLRMCCDMKDQNYQLAATAANEPQGFLSSHWRLQLQMECYNTPSYFEDFAVDGAGGDHTPVDSVSYILIQLNYVQDLTLGFGLLR